MRIIVYSIDKQTGIYTSDGRHLSQPPYLDFILADNDGDTIQGLVNIDDDVAGLIALLELNDKEKEKLASTERLFLSPYSIAYFPQKFFGIDKGGGHGHPYSNLADIAQYNSDLDRIENRHDDDYWFGRANNAYKTAKEVYDNMITIVSPIKSLISPKSIYEPEMVKMDLPKATDIPPEASEIAYDTCVGNWVECYQRGRFDIATDFDITSSYPSWASRLYDLRYGRWVHSSEYQPKAYYGYVIAEVMIEKEFSPIIWQSPDSENFTFTGICPKLPLTKNALDYIIKYNLGYYTLIDGWWWFPDKTVKPLQAKLNELYQLKQQSQGIKRELVKRVMNGSFYGRFMQEKGGKVDNIVAPYGAEIQTNTRLQVASFAEKNNLVSNILVVAVDGLLIDGKVDITLENNMMGSWRKSYQGEAVVVHSGLNCIDGKFGEGDFSLSLEDLKSLFNSNPDANNWTIRKPSVMTLGKAANEHKLDKVGDIMPTSKTVYLYENKREYSRHPKSGNDLMNKKYKGKSWDIGILQALTIKEGELDDAKE